jgi:hypothetical protein
VISFCQHTGGIHGGRRDTGSGDRSGPCVEACEHRDCAASRSTAAAKCQRCGEAIGFGVRFYTIKGSELVHEHAACAERAADEALAAGAAAGSALAAGLGACKRCEKPMTKRMKLASLAADTPSGWVVMGIFHERCGLREMREAKKKNPSAVYGLKHYGRAR